MKKAHSVGTHFSYLNRQAVLMSFRKQMPDQPAIKVKVDLNGTRVATQHGLLHSLMRLNRLLRMYMAATPDAPYLSDVDWVTLSEIESVLNISKSLTTLMQYETKYNGAFGQVIKHILTIELLRADHIVVVDMHKVIEKALLASVRVCANTFVPDF